MQDFSIQVLATLVSTFIIFVIEKIVKSLIKRIPSNFWYELLYKLGLLTIYLFDVNNLALIIKSYVDFSFSFKYLIYLISLTFCLYITIDLSIFIKQEFFKNKSNE